MKLIGILSAGVAALALTTAANAADLPSRRAPAPVAVAAPIFTWAGSYVGVNLGAWINNSTAGWGWGWNGGSLGNGTGFVGGLTLGHNWQFGNGFVAGLETDIDYRTGVSVSGAGLLATSTRHGYLGTVRGRLGMGLDRALIYVTGGLAYGNSAGPKAIIAPWGGYAGTRLDNDDTLQFGWTIGAGLEYAITPNWSVKGEYLYADLGSRSLKYGPAPGFATAWVPVNTKEHIIRAGVNYRFSTWGAPVIARY